MDLSNYLLMRHEMSLMVIFIALIVYDLFASDISKKYFHSVACALFLLHTILGFLPQQTGSSFAGMYVSNEVEILVKNILNIGVFIVLLQANTWLKEDKTIIRRGEYFMLVILTLLGMYLMISSGNFLLFFIGLETASLPISALIAFDKHRYESAESGAKFIFNSIFSSAIMVFGLSFMYGVCGTLYFQDLSVLITSSPILVLSLVFFLGALFFKISLVPFHFWTADVYEGAPINVTSYLSTISKGAAVFTLMSILYKVFGNLAYEWHAILWWAILASITIGNLFAMRQKNIKRFLAFSSISQAGYIVLGVLSASSLGMSSTIYYILIYAVSNLAAFGVANVIECKTGRINIPDYNGLYKTNPNLALIMMLAVFSLAGIPPTAGFFSKFFVFTAAAAEKEYLLLFFALINTVISLYYYLLVVKAMFITKSEEPIEYFKTDVYMKLSLFICVVGIIVLGFSSDVFEYMMQVSFGM